MRSADRSAIARVQFVGRPPGGASWDGHGASGGRWPQIRDATPTRLYSADSRGEAWGPSGSRPRGVPYGRPTVAQGQWRVRPP